VDTEVLGIDQWNGTSILSDSKLGVERGSVARRPVNGLSCPIAQPKKILRVLRTLRVKRFQSM
jgi:hypothetical protein